MHGIRPIPVRDIHWYATEWMGMNHNETVEFIHVIMAMDSSYVLTVNRALANSNK